MINPLMILAGILLAGAGIAGTIFKPRFFQKHNKGDT